MNKYEVAVILNPNLDEETVESEYNLVKDLFERNGATLDKVDDWGKRRLAYEIDKLNEGYYRFFTILAESDAPAQIEARLRLRESIIRYLIIRVDE